jgi:hypothetical protein
VALVALVSPSSTVASATTPSSDTVWLCRPGLPQNPCQAPLATTVVAAHGPDSIQLSQPRSPPDIDCFYVDPTVSRELALNSDLRIQTTEIDTARAQASRFSSACRIWAPVYRQRTILGLLDHSVAARTAAIAYRSLQPAWND